MASDTPIHPYYPLGVAIPDYVANTLSTPTIIAIFATACSVALLPAFFLIRRARPNLSSGELATALWFVLCGCIHLILEGLLLPFPPLVPPWYIPASLDRSLHHLANCIFPVLGNFALYHVAGGSSVLSQLWKEYSLSDSRYLTRDAFTVCMETITAFAWGPLSFLLVYLITTIHPARYFMQTVVSLGQLYGTVLYFGTSLHEDLVRGLEFSRPEGYYFYGYFVFLNTIWIVIPTLLLMQSGKATVASFGRVRKTGKRD
ncbi:hypothetical protein DL766_004487 [Monosporascus sp. MC13-8B]|uniref:EXPERA domain-containing protein n=1 Tax=Monosporascus cannonballus TaxID=155416 RepID=A0ABY0GZW2_9PEZI|nr:hypothetical protein DL762_007182 [Monosporascus cannonballus]RYO86136.1 hypothetical protein DL763_006829 [Monosporascus cannonballus]RYP31179.1 hypothetical protein DL766_004487 [Monosporascus sp. MC13-8B]